MESYDPWESAGLPWLNVAASTTTRVLGPGLRGVVWVQGCCFHCPGCIAPDWIAHKVGRLVRPQELAEELLADAQVSGLTFSGGEPMLQAAGLAELARAARRMRDVSVICFSGFTLEQLHAAEGRMTGVSDLLRELDVLIDGQYVAGENDALGMRGSSGQRVHLLSERLREFDFEHAPRQAEIRIGDGYAFLVGVPPPGLAQAFEQTLRKLHGEDDQKGGQNQDLTMG